MEAGGLNLYGFCRNNSTNLWDYLGMTPIFTAPTDHGDASDSKQIEYADEGGFWRVSWYCNGGTDWYAAETVFVLNAVTVTPGANDENVGPPIDVFGLFAGTGDDDFAPNNAGNGIAYANHPVTFGGVPSGGHHSKIVITPTDQAKYANDPRFQNIDKNGNRYATVGGGPDKGLSKGLWGGVNRERDVSFPNNNLQGLAIPGTYKNEDAAIAALFTLVDNYKMHPVSDYDFFPGKNSDAYNSNSFVSGILNAGGFTPPSDPGASVPGYSKPVPWTYFRPRRRPKRKDVRSRSRPQRSRELQTVEGVV